MLGNVRAPNSTLCYEQCDKVLIKNSAFWSPRCKVKIQNIGLFNVAKFCKKEYRQLPPDHVRSILRLLGRYLNPRRLHDRKEIKETKEK